MAAMKKQSVDKTAALHAQQQEFERHLFPSAVWKNNKNNRAEGLEQQSKSNREQVKAPRKQTVAEDPREASKKSIDPLEREKRKKRQLERQIPFLYDNKQSHPIIEYKPSQEEIDSSAITPSFVLEVTWPRIVQFYHPSSSYCKDFQPIYISIARGIKHLSSRLPVEFHAVNCARYREVCDYGFAIETVPSLIGLKSGEIKWTIIELSDDADVDELVQYVADAVNVRLDTAAAHSLETYTELVQHDSNDEHMARSIANSLLYKNDKVKIKEAPSIPQSEQVFHDAMSSFVVTLTSSLYSQLPHGSALPPDRSVAFREFIDLIRWVFPPETQLHELATSLAEHYFTISTSEAGLLSIVGQHTNIHEGITWSSRCSGADSSQDGYSCGLWALLHIISVGVAERHDAVVGDSDRLSVLYAGRVMRSFINEFFIHCETCRQLWVTLYDEVCCELHNSDHSIADRTYSGSADGQDWRQLAFWIWEIHNEITVRTKHAAGKGYYSKYSHIASTKLLWPSPNDCPRCWQTVDNGNGQMTNMNSYDETAVYSYLRRIYWTTGIHNNRHILLDKWTRAKRHITMQHLREKMQSHRGLTVNIVLWIMCLCWLIRSRCKQHIYRIKRREEVKEHHNHEEDIDRFSFERNHMHRNRLSSRRKKISMGRVSHDGFCTQHATKRSNSRLNGSTYGSRHHLM